MAKKIQGAEITFRVTDDGTLKMVGQKAEKTAKSMDKLGGASQATDRRIKGVTQQSSNASKNFSKQAQTMQGGIVAVYATIAARVFAVSAAFQFMKEAFETRNLIEGQLAFGAATGVAYGTMTEGIIKASGGLIQFKEAAQAAAIGSAAGLSADQLNRLGTAAKNTSLALGRDLTDSFNRLIRGTTKAEPELLDELGIILRLEPAMEKYALMIGKSKDDLNQFEKSQAVANEVLDQAESKFGAIEKTMDPAGFALQKFLKAFDDLMKGVKETVTNMLIPVMGFFANNIASLVGTMLLFLAPILRTIMPNFGAMSDKLSLKADAHAEALGRETVALQRLEQEYKDFDNNMGTKDIAEQDRSLEFEKAGMEKTTTSGHTRASKHYHKQTEELEAGTLKKRTGKYKKFGSDQVKILDDANDKVVNHSKKSWLKVRMHMGKTGKWFKTITTGMKIKWAATMKFMVRGAQMMATAVNWAMKAMGWLGVLLMVIDGLKMLWQWIFPPDEAKKKQQESFDGMLDHYKNLNIEVKRMNEAQELGVNNLQGSIQQIGSAFQSVDLTKVISDYNSMLQMGKINTKEGKEMISNVTGQLDILSGGDERMQPLIAALKEGKHISEAWLKEQADSEGGGFMKLANDMMAAAQATKLLNEQQKSLDSTIKSVMGSIKQNKFTDVLKNYRTVLGTLELRSNAADVGMVGLERGRDAAKTTFDSADKAHSDYLAKGYTSDYAMKKLANLKHIRDEAKKAYEQQQQNVKDAKQDQKDWNTQKNKTAEIETRINALIKEQFEINQALLDVKIEAAMISTVDQTASTKNARLEIKNLEQQNKLRERQQELKAATLAIDTASDKDMADEEWLKAARDTEEQARKNLFIEQLTTARVEERVSWQQLINTLKEREMRFNMTMARIDKERTREIKKQAMLIKEQTTDAGKWNETMQSIYDMSAKNAEIRMRLQASFQRIQDMNAAPERDKAAIEKEYGNFRKLTDQLRDGILDQNLKYREQLVILKDIAGQLEHNRNMVAGRMDMGRDSMFGGDAIGARGSQFGQINPNAKTQREFLQKQKVGSWDEYAGKISQTELDKWQTEMNEAFLKENPLAGTTPDMWLPDEAKLAEFKESGKEAVENWKRITEETAQVGIELELANSIQNSMQSAFEGMFQALIDGTKSFGDAMKDVMKQLLADLAAAYMKAAALKMLSAMGMGLPARYGGELSASGKSFAAGGIASGPTSGYLATLHGREAVVPLGNDRSIPVDIKGASGNVVNVAVNISGGQSQTSASGGGADMQALGRSIGGLVQQHLQTEMRPGGLLNRQGVQGRQGGGG